MANCTPPVDIAYHLLHVSPKENLPIIDKEDVKGRLGQLFARLGNDNFVTENSDYLRYLLSKSTTQTVVVEAHKESITRFLTDHSQKLNVLQRWMGFEGRLNQVASNPNYLLMFHALASVPNQQPMMTLEVIQQAVTALLDEYVETGWFISAERKNWATILKVQISAAKDIDAVLRVLSSAQVDTAKKDIAENETRYFKPLHFFGSRYQTTLNRALGLTLSLSGKTEVDTLTNDLVPLVPEVTDNTSIKNLTVDELKQKANSKKQDRGNASVILESLENAISIKNRKSPEGMIGRSSIFRATRSTSLEDEIYSLVPSIG